MLMIQRTSYNRRGGLDDQWGLLFYRWRWLPCWKPQPSICRDVDSLFIYYSLLLVDTLPSWSLLPWRKTELAKHLLALLPKRRVLVVTVMGSVLVCWGCKVPQAYGLKNRLTAQFWNQGVCRVGSISGCDSGSVPASLLASGSSLACGNRTPISTVCISLGSCLCVEISPFY